MLEYGKILRRMGEPERSVRVLEDALEQLSRSGDERCSVRTLTAMGTALIDRGDAEAAGVVLRASLQRGADLNERHTSRVALAGVAQLFAAAGQFEEAATLFGFVEALGRQAAIPVSEASRGRRTRLIESIRSRMDPHEFDFAREAGGGMDLKEAIAFANAPSS